MPLQSAGPALWKRKRVWAFGALLVLLLSAGLLSQSFLQKGWTTYADQEDIKAIALDRQGRVWTLGYGAGLPTLMLYPGQGERTQVSLPAELTTTSVSALAVDGKDRVWVGTVEGLIGMQETTGEWRIFHPAHPNTDNPVWVMLADGGGQVWARSNWGPGWIDPEAGNPVYALTNSGLVDHNAAAITTDAEGGLWALTRQRELKVLGKDGSWRTHASVPEAVTISPFGSVLAVDPLGQVWLPTDDGLGVLRPDGTWTVHKLGEPARVLGIKHILPASGGRVWIASEFQGLFLFDPETGWRHFTVQNSGLSSNSVIALAPDAQGGIWMGTSGGGLSQFNPEGASPVQVLPTFSLLTGVIVPAALLSIVLFGILWIAFARPGVGRSGRLRDFSIACACWFILNGLLWTWIRYSHEQSGGLLIINPLVLVPLPVNILAFVLSYRVNRWMALGVLAAFIVNWIGLIIVQAITNPSGAFPFYEAVFMIPFFLPG